MPECHFGVRLASGKRVGVVANVDTSPQAYQRLERTVVEDGQQFGEMRGFTPPVDVPGLGLAATWLPDQARLLTTDGVRLITITVSWRGASQARAQALGRAVARPYLGKLQPKAADPNGT
jgi:hypothetical protein